MKGVSNGRKRYQEDTGCDTNSTAADKYTIQELENASTKVFGVPRECAVAAFKGCKKTEMTVAEAKQIIDRFMKKEVK